MQLSRENGFFTSKDGAEVYVKKGVLYADDDPAVRAVPSIFDRVSDDAPKSAPAQKRVTASASGSSQVKGGSGG
jgi:hypothetical protein